MDKWLAICIIGFTVGMFSPVMVSEYSKGQCRLEAIKVNKSAEEIKQICK
jgi:hypothetical protein